MPSVSADYVKGELNKESRIDRGGKITMEKKTKLKRKRKDDGSEHNNDTVISKLKRKTTSSHSREKKARERAGQTKNNVVDAGDHEEAKLSDAVTAPIKYVPPHLRESEKGAEEIVRLRRRIRGLLNKLSEANLESITSDISMIYQAQSRHSVMEIISNEIVGACCQGPRGNEQYAAVFAAFVAGMSATSGIDFGAKFVAVLAESFEDQYHKGDGLALRNLALLLSNLYTFRLLSSEIIFEVLGILCKRFEELDVATILTILQSCGMGLRGDDPSGMKDFVITIQLRTAEVKAALFNKSEATSGGLSKRVQFMLDMICDIKNNKRLSKEAVPHVLMKKWLQKVRVEDVILRAVTWQQLLDPAKKGQWWLPSSVRMDSKTDVRGKVAGAMDAGISEAEKMLQLAASQRMNTDSRRAVFCIVMSGEDYVDAFEKLLRMKLPGTQDREVLRVVVECCLQEKIFNKYYALLAAKLCNHDKNHKFTLQYCLWDQFKQLDAMELRRTANLARFLAHMIGSHSLSLAVLKPVDFTDPEIMTPKVLMHFRIFLDSLLTENSEEVIWNCFSRVAAPPKLSPLREGLNLFLHQQIKRQKGDQGFLPKRYQLASKALANSVGLLLK